jgi:tetratricopeptide (TPR) repeat protein
MKRLDTSRIEGPVELFERSISLMKRSGMGEKELRNDKLAFYKRLGTTYMTLYESHRGHDEKDFRNAIDAFGKVLEIDSSNYLANYNTGILYYNRGVQIAQKADPAKMEVELRKVKELQKKSTKVFKKALPYMKEAHEQRPDRIETLEGLSGIYYSLNEDEKVERYKKRKQKILQEKR